MSARLAWSATVLFLAIARPAPAQSLGDRIARANDGEVTFTYAARPGVCGDGDRFIRLGRSYVGSFDAGPRQATCEAGPALVALTIRHGVVENVRARIGHLRQREEREERDLGTVSAPDAAQYLLWLARHGPADASARAILPAVIADSATVWPALLAIARDTRDRPRKVRAEAGLWLSHFATPPCRAERMTPSGTMTATVSARASSRTRCSCSRSSRVAKGFPSC